jgi:hypothetical protein
MDERDRLMGAAQRLAKGCCSVAVLGSEFVDPCDVQAIARGYVAQRLADAVEDRERFDWFSAIFGTLFLCGSVASIGTLVLTVARN